MDHSRVSGLDDSGIAESDNRDRLSELPEHLISRILSLLSVREVVNISLVSKLYYSYNDSWTTNPCLEFWNHSSTLAAFRNFVSGALPLWKGSKILRFSISFVINQRFCCWSRLDTSDLDSWLRFAIDKQVEELHFNLADSLDLAYCKDKDHYSPDECLYSCSSIRKLSIVSCKLSIDKNVQWDHLQSLTIEGCCSLSSLDVVRILSGSPRLEVLNLHILETNQSLKIQSTSLKILKISRFEKAQEFSSSFDEYNFSNPNLEISAPNLETLELFGFLYGSYVLNVPSITNSVLDIYHDLSCYAARYVDHYALHLIEEIVQVVRSICHAENVTLSNWCIKVLFSKKKINCALLPVLDATHLKICGGAAGEILGILEIFPKLKVLILELKDALPKLNYDFLYEDLRLVEIKKRQKRFVVVFYGNIPCSALLHLRKVEITGLVWDTSITPFIANVLRNAHLLEKMVFRVIPCFDRNLFHETAEKLLSLPRSSPNAEVTITRLI